MHVLPDHRLWYGLQAGRDLYPFLPLLSPWVREHIEVVRAELGRVRQLHGRDEVGTKHLHRERGRKRRDRLVKCQNGEAINTRFEVFTGQNAASDHGR